MTHNMEEVLQRLDRLERVLLLSSKEVYTTEEASLYVGVSEESIRRWCRAGELTHFKVRGKLFVKKADIDDFLMNEKIESKRDLNERVNQYLLNRKRRR